MHSNNKLFLSLASFLILLSLAGHSHCQATGSGFSHPRPSAANIIMEPTISFIRTNLQMINNYVMILRSIMVGAFERPLRTSTDRPVIGGPNRGPKVKVPPMDLPVASGDNRFNRISNKPY